MLGRRPFVLRVVLSVSVLLPNVGSTQPSPGNEPVVPEKAGKEIHAYRLTGTPPRIDGHRDDEVWTLAEARDDLVQNEPDNMAAPRERTSMQFAYDGRTLYVFVQCFVTDVSQVTSGLGRRDTMPPSDLVRLFIDPRHDHQNAYAFETNPSGVLSDYLLYDDTRISPDYDAVWNVRTTITAEGWNAEYAIPFSQMRFRAPPGAQTVWGLNLRRDNFRSGEFDRWVPTPRGAAGLVSRFGHLIFDERLDPPRRIEFLPVTLARVKDTADRSATLEGAAGLDARIGLGTGATLSATLNPDFAQVEQDPSVLNLSVFEQFFPERRPFFLEDSRMFVPNFPQLLLFHSRRIGRAPSRVSVASAETVLEKPDTTTILAATKLTGTTSVWNYGAIAALTAAETARVDVNETDALGREAAKQQDREIEPRSTYGVGRVFRTFRAGTSNIGGMMTAVVRDGDTDAYTGGLDHTFRWNQNRGSWSGLWTGSHAAAAGETPRSGFAGLTNVNYGRKHVAVNAHFDRISPNFRNSDLGFLASRVNKTNINGGMNLMQPDPWKRLRSVFSWTYGSRSWNDAKLVFDKRFGGGVDVTFKNFYGGYFEVHRDFERFDDLDARGGPTILKPARSNIFTGFRTDPRRTWQLFSNFAVFTDAFGGTSYRFAPWLRLPPMRRLQAQLGGEYEWGNDVAQWIQNTDVTGDGTNDSIYGRLKRNVIGITGRGTLAFSRNMTLEAYLQPFVAVGDYTNTRRLTRERSFDFEPAELSTNPDFNNKNLRANIVFRWEYVKGSTLFVVWNRSTDDKARPGVFSARRDLGGAFTGPGTNVVIVKLNYWLGL